MRLNFHRLESHIVTSLRSLSFFTLVFLISLAGYAAESFTVLDAADRGADASESGRASILAGYDESRKEDVIELSYSLPSAGRAGFWAKNFPAAVQAENVDTIKISLKLSEAAQREQISVSADIRGTAGSQTIPLELQAGWSNFEESIDWTTVGRLEELRINLKASNSGPVEGTLNIIISFSQAAPPQERPETAPAETANAPEPEIEAELTAPAPAPPPAPTAWTLLDAGQRGVDMSGAAAGGIMPTFDEAANKDVLEFDYSLAEGDAIKIWVREFPSSLRSGAVNASKISIRILEPGQAEKISVVLELKGSLGIQSVPVVLKSGWNSALNAVDWERIGVLNEAALALAPAAGETSARGTLNVALDFVKLSDPGIIHRSRQSTASYSLFDAGEKGVFNIGASKGTIAGFFNENLGKDVWAFEYSLPVASVVGIWTKSYPGDLDASAADAVHIGVQVPDANQLTQASVKLEIKGESGMQTIPLSLKPGSNLITERINWGTIGALTEVVFVVSPMAVGPLVVSPVGLSPMENKEPVKGTLYFDLEFGKLSFMQKNSTLIKVALALLLGLLASLGTALGLRAWKRENRPGPRVPEEESEKGRLAAILARDFFYGTVTVLIAGAALYIYSLSSINALSGGFHFGFAGIGLAGVFIAWFIKFRLTGTSLSPREVFQNFVACGLLAIAASKQEILQAPSNWVQVFQFSALVSAVTFAIYQFSNARSLATSRRHLSIISSVLIVGTPYLFNWLLLAENANFLQDLMNGLTGHLLAAWPPALEFAGRLLVIFLFNEAVTNGISLSTKGRLLKSGVAHAVIFAVSLAVVVSPHVADLGSTQAVGGLAAPLRALVAVLTTALSFAGLWGEVYLLTGISLDGGHSKAPSRESILNHVNIGVRKGLAYSGILTAILYVLYMIFDARAAQTVMSHFPLPVGIIAGGLIFPFVKTIIETFDGSIPFFERTRFSYRDPVLYARGAIVGFGFAHMISHGLFQAGMSERIGFGLFIGLAASGGVSFLRDFFYGFRGQGKVQSWRLYLVDSLLGAFVGSAVAFYLDSRQVPVILEKFKLYTMAGFDAVDYITYPLLNKWGRIDLGTYTGGVKLLYTESLAGVINWSIAAWLFAINKVFMQAFFDKDKAPIKFFFSKEGFATLIEHMIYVLRWGLWMSPIIFTFLRMMPEATWYNQDGAIRTLFAAYQNVTLSPEAFQQWSLQVFVYILAFDLFRILIWMDHMGLRVATLVNLSFLGMDKLDEKISRFIGPAAAQRYIPEGVKRFTTWAPLLIPFYLPRGTDWDYVWNTAEAMQNAARGHGLMAALQSLSVPQMILLIALSTAVATAVSFTMRALSRRAKKRRQTAFELENREYRVVVKESGEAYSEVLSKEFFDVTRRSYDLIDPCGRTLFLLDSREDSRTPGRFWPVVGNFPRDQFETSRIGKADGGLQFTNLNHGVRTTVDIKLPDLDSTAEVWTITVENMTAKQRELKMVPYLEWVLNGWIHDRFHTQYARLYPEMEYKAGANAILTWQKATKSMGFLASDAAPEGFLTSRMDFIGRAQSIWAPRIFETLAFSEARDTAGYPTFDPIGSLLIHLPLRPKTSKTVRLIMGYAKNRDAALGLIRKYLNPVPAETAPPAPAKKKYPLIGHGEILPGTPQPYSEFTDHGRTLLVRTPFTPRPYDHALSNAIHSVMVTNRGLHTSCNGNSQQNRLTPDWPDTVTKEIPTEAIYLHDPETHEWFSPTYHPLNKMSAHYESEFSVDGTAVFRMTEGSLSSRLTVFVPAEDPAGIYLLTVKNNSDRPRKLRVSPYFQMVLSFQPERSGTLTVKRDPDTQALFFENPRNMFRTGWAFASMSLPADQVETRRGRYFGTDRGTTHPFLVEQGGPDETQLSDDRQIAAFLGTLEVPARGEASVAVVLGQTDRRDEALKLVRKYKDLETVKETLDQTRQWWLNLMGTAQAETNRPEFDRLLHWLKYQAVAERIWARRGFYQTSGAFGFRDQLQDTVNMIWVDPSLARKQIILHASQQFVEGDVFHWFFTLPDGRTAFSCRSHASDNPVWLPWAAVEYVRGTGDYSVLDEMASYVVSEFPFAPLPKNKQGWGHLYHRSTRADSIYRHCMKSINLVLHHRMGKHGLPLIQTGDWNDGLDEIGSEGRGESVWLGFFLYYILKQMIPIIEVKEGGTQKEHYTRKMKDLGAALERTWRGDRYLRAIHDDGTEIGVKDSGIWEIDALTAAWAVISGLNLERGLIVFNTALHVLEKENAILLGWPALREDTKPYLGRSSKYPEGVRENGMYCHGVQWLVRAARILAEEFDKDGDRAKADEYRETAYRLWLKVSAIPHTEGKEIEIYGGQPNKQSADILTNFDQGRMIWHGYTGAAGWMLRQAFEGVLGATLSKNRLVLPQDLDKNRGPLKVNRIYRNLDSLTNASGGFKQPSKLKVQPPELAADGNPKGR
jgi:cyclic beta-1,2-glucan synthetase